MSVPRITEHTVTTASHTTFYLACGPEDGPLIMFVHGWPELSLSWRHQLPALAALGFRCIAPDMRGYGRSTVYKEHSDYAQELIVADMMGLLDALGRKTAVWIGHDWGSAVVWNIATHHADRCTAVASLCVPYTAGGLNLDALISLVDRDLYPEATYPAGQWEYMRFYEENFQKATGDFDRDIWRTVKLIFRKGDPDSFGQVSGTAHTRINGGWFGPLEETPDVPADEDIASEEELKVYAKYLGQNTFFGPDSWYMNHPANAVYGQNAEAGDNLDMPVLFIGAMYDGVCETITSRAKDPMIEHCSNLTLDIIKSGHWMAQEKPLEVNAALTKWLATEVSDFWPPHK